MLFRSAGSDSGPDPQTIVTVVPGVPRYHNATCILIRFMGEGDLDKMTIAVAGDAGCTPCRACLPDQLNRPAELPARVQARLSQNRNPRSGSTCSVPVSPVPGP